MRLLQQDDDGKLSLVEFIGINIPPYAILSHTWSQTDKEITFAAFLSGEFAENPEYAESYKKIRRCGEQAKRDGLGHFWVDTCCINKESSAELSEAINSMYAWYRDADVCYAYLHDVHDKTEFKNSRWFRRGWTLQELLAPADVIFFDAAWSTIGFKTSLIETLSRYTGINAKALHGTARLNEFSIAEKMSWAACRQTSRIEDEAYCLMGLFDINMPLIYGEGQRAFLRLQEELLRTSNDGSILAYIAHKAVQPSSMATTKAANEDSLHHAFNPEKAGVSDEAPFFDTTGLFASSPSMFQYSADYVSHPTLRTSPFSQEGDPIHARIRRSGYLIEISALLWKPVNFQWPHHIGKSDMVGLGAYIEEVYGLKFTMWSIRKLALCMESYSDWAVAFLDCRRRRGGIVGIVMLPDFDRGTCERLHFPSIVETTSISCDDMTALAAAIIHIEADMVVDSYRGTNKLHVQGDETLQHVVYRTANFSDYGLSRHSVNPSDRAEYRPTRMSDIPCILFAQSPYNSHYEDGLDCILFTDTKPKDGDSTSEVEVQNQVRVPTNRGSTTSITLTNGLQLLILGRMQWARSVRPGIDHASKQCLLTLYIEEQRHSKNETVLLDDGVYVDPFQPVV
ncbi:HET domain containing protein [Stagonosporopsis vannaccii]|nr:HET domain containing protein [Stagonosporopsis vannaccii]